MCAYDKNEKAVHFELEMFRVLIIKPQLLMLHHIFGDTIEKMLHLDLHKKITFANS